MKAYNLARTYPAVIEYKDANGDASRREVDFHRVQVAADGKTSFLGFCRLRDDVRMFRIDRIKAVITDDGEVIAPDGLVQDILGSAGLTGSGHPGQVSDVPPANFARGLKAAARGVRDLVLGAFTLWVLYMVFFVAESWMDVGTIVAGSVMGGAVFMRITSGLDDDG